MSASHSFAESSLFFRRDEVPGGRSLQLRPVPEAEPVEKSQGAPERIAGLREQLDEHLSKNLSTATELIEATALRTRRVRATTIPAIDQLIGGLEPGTLTELNGWRSAGRFSIVLATLAALTSCGEPVALVDRGGHLDPQNASAAGVDLARLLWIRPESIRDAAAVAEMTINAGFPLVVVDLGLSTKRDANSRRVPDAAWIRLARRAAEHGATLLVSAPFHTTGTSAATVMTIQRPRPAWIGRGRSPRLLAGIEAPVVLEKHRTRRSGARTSLLAKTEDAVGAPASSPAGRAASSPPRDADRSNLLRENGQSAGAGAVRLASLAQGTGSRDSCAPVWRPATDDPLSAHGPRPPAHALRKRR